jgi:Spy/CpxP family protein refolding chaperone
MDKKIPVAVLFLTIVALLFLPVSAYAQVDESSPEDIFARMKADLNLTQAQNDAIEPIIKEYSAKLQEFEQGLKDEGVFYDMNTSDQIKRLRAEENQKLMQVLTPSQLEKWKNRQRMRNFFNQGQSEDKGWESKGNGIGMGINF